LENGVAGALVDRARASVTSAVTSVDNITSSLGGGRGAPPWNGSRREQIE
jgi:hypothetical protein